VYCTNCTSVARAPQLVYCTDCTSVAGARQFIVYCTHCTSVARAPQLISLLMLGDQVIVIESR
jgi:hypothetical protein